MASSDTVAPNIENPLSSTPSSTKWIQTLELGYDEPEPRNPICFACGSSSSDKHCSKCNVAAYCSRECQKNDWKEGHHKLACDSYSRLNSALDDHTKALIRTEIFARIRFYACPYAVHKTSQLGRGFLFIQSDTTLRDLSIDIPKDMSGRPMMTRAILMHFLTIGEYDLELCREDFEITSVRTNLQQAIESYDPEKEVVLLWRLRCGHVALGLAVLVPDVGICKTLGNDYYADNPAGAVQLNLDDL
jgi:hypothetical protein